MLFIMTMLLIIAFLIILIYIRNKEKTPIRLEKQVTVAERIQNWINKYKGYIIIATIMIALILFVLCILAFAPGTESGAWYNGGVENAVS